MVDQPYRNSSRSGITASLLLVVLAMIFGCADSESGAKPAEQTQAGVNNTLNTSDNLERATAFLEENAQKQGITVTSSGLQYEIISQGSGKTPTFSDTVVTHYAGRFLDGTEFDSSIQRGTPATFPVSGVIKGWTEALQLMQEGDKWRLFIPPDLAYGSAGVGPIPPDSALIFDIELIEVK